MAGISTPIIKRARGLLNASVQDDANGLNNQGQMSVFSLTAAPAQFEGVDELKELRDAVLGFNLNSATPLQAMAVIEAWQKVAKKSAGDS
jgi:DNA mismatch repair ATPase MutS